MGKNSKPGVAGKFAAALQSRNPGQAVIWVSLSVIIKSLKNNSSCRKATGYPRATSNLRSLYFESE